MEGGTPKPYPRVSHGVFVACESPLTGEEYRANNTSKKGALEIMNQAGDKICCEGGVPRVADSCSSLARCLY